jgi:TfoX/Sxy family transcriptional regulator of competence genes
MAYDELLAVRIRAALSGQSGLKEAKMFGGVGFLLNGNMACGVHKNDLIVRVGSEKHAQALSRPNARVFDLTGKPMTGWVSVSSAGFASEQDLKGWLRLGVDFANTLPPKRK